MEFKERLQLKPGPITTLMRSKIINDFPYTYAKFGRLTDKTQHQPARFRHSEEVPRMDPNPTLKECQHGSLVWFKSGNPQNRIPAAFGFEPVHFGNPHELTVQLRQVGKNTLADLALDRRALLEPGRQRALHRSIHGKEGIGDDLQPLDCLRLARPGGHNPRRLHLRHAGDLAQPAHHEDRDPLESRSEALPRFGESVVKKVLPLPTAW